MKTRIFLGIVFVLLLMGMLPLTFDVQQVEASGTIYIWADGSIDPPTANITTADNVTYTFTGNIYDKIVVQRSNIVIDGKGYILEGDGYLDGFYLHNISNTTIKNTNIRGFEIGVFLHSASNNTIIENNIINNEAGIGLGESSNNIICGNNITGNSENGIWLDWSSCNIISGNVMNGNIHNFDVWGSQLSHFMNSIDVSNLVDGKPVYYLINQTNLMINPAAHPKVGYLALINCANITVEGLTLTKNMEGLLLAYTNNSRITGNIIINNDSGVALGYSYNNTVYGNDITNNTGAGLWLNNSSDNTISGNNMIDNWGEGIYLEFSSNNTFYHNNFINNTNQVVVHESGYVNTWDDGYPSGGNYWSDHEFVDKFSGPYQNETGSDGIVDDPYWIDENNTDRYPLMNPWIPIKTSVRVMGEDYPVTIVSNTTISQIGASENTLYFTSSGQLGEKGYVNVIFPMVNTSNIRVYINGTEITPLINDNGTHYFIYFEFTFSSTYIINIEFAPIVPVGGIYIPVNKLELLSPYIELTILLAIAVATIGYVKKRKRNTEISSRTNNQRTG